MNLFEALADGLSRLGSPFFNLFEKYWWVLLILVVLILLIVFKVIRI